MTGHAMPWNIDDTDQRRAIKQLGRDQKVQAEKSAILEKQQKVEMDQRRKKLNQQQIAMLRSRFGVAGGGAPVDTMSGSGLQTMSDTPGSLYARITGR